MTAVNFGQWFELNFNGTKLRAELIGEGTRIDWSGVGTACDNDLIETTVPENNVLFFRTADGRNLDVDPNNKQMTEAG